MKNYKYYTEINPNIYKRCSTNNQYLVLAFLLFSLGIGFVFARAPHIGAYLFAGIMLMFGCGFLLRISSSVVIDLNSETILQKGGFLSSTKQITFSDVQTFSISNRIYVLLQISSAFAVIMDGRRQKSVLLGQSFMNPKNTEMLLLETEKILSRR